VTNSKKNDARSLPKRFYKDVSVAEAGGPDDPRGYQLLLDGRPVKTPGKLLISVPARQLADALAEEWRAQAETIDPATMAMTRIVNSSLDGVSGREVEVAADIAAFAGSDLTCYRADGPEDLVALQAAAWDPVLAWAREAFGGRFVVAQGVMPVEQPPESIAVFAGELAGYEALQLGALHVMTTLTGSALIALAHAHGVLSTEEAWAVAHVDEDFQIARWGADEDAAERRTKRWAEFRAASRIFMYSAAALNADCG